MSSATIPVTPVLEVVIALLLLAADSVVAIGGFGRFSAVVGAGVRGRSSCWWSR